MANCNDYARKFQRKYGIPRAPIIPWSECDHPVTPKVERKPTGLLARIAAFLGFGKRTHRRQAR